MNIVFSATLAYLFIWFVLRVLGKRELSEMSAFDLILLFIIGDLVATAVVKEDTSATSAMIAVGTLALLTVLLSWISWRFKRLRAPLDGLPCVIIRDGELDVEMLAIERVSLDDVLEAARSSGITDLADVDLAVLEPNGNFSFFTAR